MSDEELSGGIFDGTEGRKKRKYTKMKLQPPYVEIVDYCKPGYPDRIKITWGLRHSTVNKNTFRIVYGVSMIKLQKNIFTTLSLIPKILFDIYPIELENYNLYRNELAYEIIRALIGLYDYILHKSNRSYKDNQKINIKDEKNESDEE